MKKQEDIMFCTGGRCVLRLTCERFRIYRELKFAGKSVIGALIPIMDGHECIDYVQSEYYGG